MTNRSHRQCYPEIPTRRSIYQAPFKPYQAEFTLTIRFLQTQIPTFRGTKDSLNKFEHLSKNHLHPMSHRLTDEVKLQHFQSLPREEANDFYQSLKVLTKFRKDITKDDLKEVIRPKLKQAKNNPTAETFSDFLKLLNVIAKQAFQDNAGQNIQTLLFAKLLILIQQKLRNSNKEDASPTEMQAFLHRRQPYDQFN